MVDIRLRRTIRTPTRGERPPASTMAAAAPGLAVRRLGGQGLIVSVDGARLAR